MFSYSRHCAISASLVVSSFLFTQTAIAEPLDFSNPQTSLDYAQVTYVIVTERAGNEWCFDTDVRHNDQGWEHYADGWEVIDMEGNQLGYRLLAHPHDNEQPFTRSLCGVKIPEVMTKVAVRAKCNVHGYGGKAIVIDLTKSKGKDYNVNKL